MALFGVGMAADPRTQPWAMLTDGKRLVEVLRQLPEKQPSSVEVENCLDGEVFQITFAAIAGPAGSMMTPQKPKWRLVRAAPSSAPETADELATA